MIRRYKLGRDADCKAHARTRLLSLIGPDARRVAGAPDRPRPSTRTAGRIGGAAVRLIATDLGVDVRAAATRPSGR
jgi:hypothetical protein